jgi:hypothetical protein
LSDYIYKVLMDLDPEQGVEDEYKNKHNQLFCWRLLRQIAYIDIGNFDLKTEGKAKPFAGNIEEQVELLHKKAPKRDIPPQPVVEELIVENEIVQPVSEKEKSADKVEISEKDVEAHMTE